MVETDYVSDTAGAVMDRLWDFSANVENYVQGRVTSEEIEKAFLDNKFANIITVSKTTDIRANFTCSESIYEGSDTACIQAAIDKAASAGTPRVHISSGTYTISNPWLITHNLKITCDPDTVFNWATITAGMIQCDGTLAATVTGTADVAQGATTVTVDSVTGVVPGDLIIIYDDVIWNTVDTGYENHKTGEIHEVSSISGSVITFFEGTLHAYTVTNNLSVQIIHPITVELSNLIINGVDGATAHRLIELTYCKNSSVHDCTLDKGGDWGIYCDNSYNVNIYKNKITHGERTTMGYGVVAMNACAHINVYNNDIGECRHGFAAGGNYLIGQCRGLKVHDNTISESTLRKMQCIDAHQIVEDISAYNNTIYSNVKYAMCTGAKSSKFFNNIVHGGHGVSIRGNVADMTIIIDNNELNNCSLVFNDYPDDDSVTNSEKLVKITNNTMNNSISSFAHIKRAKAVEISGNRVDTTTDYYGLYIENVTEGGVISQNHMSNIWRCGVSLTACVDLKVSDNVLLNCCQYGQSGDLYDAGIFLANCSRINVHHNEVRDTTGKMMYAIKVSKNSENIVIDRNDTDGAMVSSISVQSINATAAPSTIDIINNQVTCTTDTDGVEVRCTDYNISKVNIHNNTVESTTQCNGVHVWTNGAGGASDIVITNNNVTGGSYGINLKNVTGSTTRGNVVKSALVGMVLVDPCVGYVVDNNSFISCTTEFDDNVAESTRVLTNNLGVNPVGHMAAPAVPSSTTAYVNPKGYPCMVYVTGGTVSDVRIGGTATGLISGGFYIEVGGSIALVYTVAPTWIWFGL